MQPHQPLTCVSIQPDELAASLNKRLSDLSSRLRECSDDVQAAGRESAHMAVELFAETAVVWMIGPDGKTLEPIGSHDFEPLRDQQLSRLLSGARPQIGEGLIGTSVANGHVKIVNEASPDLTEGFAPYVEFCRRSDVTSILISPISAHGRVIGAFALLRRADLPNFQHGLDPALTLFSEMVGLHLDWARDLATRTRDIAILDSLDPAVISTDLDRRVTSWNRGAEILYGIPRADALGLRLDSLVPTDPQIEPTSPFVAGGQIEEDERWRVTMREGEWAGRVRQQATDGRIIDVSLRLTLLDGTDGRVLGGLVLAVESRQTDLPEVGGAVDVSGQSLLDAIDNELAIIDAHGRIIATNLRWEQRSVDGRDHSGAWVNSAPGNDLLALLRSAGTTRPSAREALAGIEGVLNGRLQRFTLPYDSTSDGADRSYVLTVKSIQDDGVLIEHADNTLQQGLERQLSYRATHDALTGLPNRALLSDRLVQALIRSQRTGNMVAVMFVDLDHFKEVNDTLGHAAGDQVLVSVSRRLLRACRASDSVTRFGGDEFVIVVEDVDSLENIRRVAQRILDALATPIVVDGSELFFGASLGVALAAAEISPTTQVDGLLRDADTAMYRAKEAGRNTYVIFDPAMRDRVANRLELTNALRHVVSRGELRVAYQPQFALDSADIVGAEALVRWQHPEWGLVPPNEFIEAAEEGGSILEIGAWVLDQACQQIANWQQLAPEDFTIHVNLSTRQLIDPNFVPLVQSKLALYGIEPGRLGLEITESALMSDPETAVRTVEDLHKLGVRISVDDFGTGYSSLAYLQRFPAHALKIDRFFISRIDHDDKTAALVKGIVSLADALGLETVAEGVETEVQRQLTEDLGCTSYQGFLRARPGTADVITGLLTALAEKTR
jgi:diguanylate cyclase (GGDEF)-like protein